MLLVLFNKRIVQSLLNTRLCRKLKAWKVWWILYLENGCGRENCPKAENLTIKHIYLLFLWNTENSLPQNINMYVSKQFTLNLSEWNQVVQCKAAIRFGKIYSICCLDVAFCSYFNIHFRITAGNWYDWCEDKSEEHSADGHSSLASY